MRAIGHSQRGSALVYILIAIALLAALTVTFMQPSSQQTTAQNTYQVQSDLESQINVIRSAVQECVLTYPRGDTTIDSTGGGTDPGARKNYPIAPNSTHYDGPPAATIPKTATRLARDIRCPGNQDGANENDHAMVFSGASGKFLGPQPTLFNDWQYYNGTDGVFFWISTSKTDAFLETALNKLDEKFAECEADVVHGAAALDSGTTVSCAASNLCFRVRITTLSPAVYNGDSDGDETAAGC